MHVKGVQWAGIGCTKAAALGQRWSVTFPVKESSWWKKDMVELGAAWTTSVLIYWNVMDFDPRLQNNWTNTRALLKTPHQKHFQKLCALFCQINLQNKKPSFPVSYSYQLHHRIMVVITHHCIAHIYFYPPQKRSFVCYLLPTVILTVLFWESILIFSHNIHCRKYQCNQNCKAAYQCKDHNASLLRLKEIKIKKVLMGWSHSSQWPETTNFK